MAGEEKKAVVIAFVEDIAGAQRLRDYARQAAAQGQVIICADSGGEAVLAWGLTPNWLVGDMDSINPETLAALQAIPSVKIIQAPAEKDETDLELALYTALDQGATEITILGGLGGRLDHTLGNLYLLAARRIAQAGAKVRLLGEDSEIYLLRGPAEIRLEGQPGDLLSLIPFTLEARGIRTTDLYYPLRSETLYLGPTRGVSNLFTAASAAVAFDEGLLLVIHTFA